MTVFRKIVSLLADTIQTLVVAGAVFAIVYLFLAQPHQVVGESMIPNFHNSEYVLTDKISYRFRNPERKEIIVFKAPNNIEKDYIKRVIALPGETVKIENGKVFVQNRLLNENQYLEEDIKTFAGTFIKESLEYQVPPDFYFVLGDNRGNSSDSREWGFVKRDNIIGRSFLIYWPLKSFKTVKVDESF